MIRNLLASGVQNARQHTLSKGQQVFDWTKRTRWRSVYQLVQRICSPDEGDDSLAVLGIVVKLLEVPLVMLRAARAGVAEGEEGKRERDDRPGGNGETTPFENLSEEVGSRHVLEHASSRNLVRRLAFIEV